MLIEVAGKECFDPVIATARNEADNVRIAFHTPSDTGRIQVAIGDLSLPAYLAWKRKTLVDTGATPVCALSTSKAPLLTYTQRYPVGGVNFRRFNATQDTSVTNYFVPGTVSPTEYRGATVSNDNFSIGMSISVFEDSLTGGHVPFIALDDTAQLWGHGDIPQRVRTDSITASRLRIEIRRTIDGFDSGSPLDVFRTDSVSWFATLRNAVNDSGIARSASER